MPYITCHGYLSCTCTLAFSPLPLVCVYSGCAARAAVTAPLLSRPQRALVRSPRTALQVGGALFRFVPDCTCDFIVTVPLPDLLLCYPQPFSWLCVCVCVYTCVCVCVFASEHMRDAARSLSICEEALADPHIRTGHKVCGAQLKLPPPPACPCIHDGEPTRVSQDCLHSHTHSLSHSLSHSLTHTHTHTHTLSLSLTHSHTHTHTHTLSLSLSLSLSVLPFATTAASGLLLTSLARPPTRAWRTLPSLPSSAAFSL